MLDILDKNNAKTFDLSCAESATKNRWAFGVLDAEDERQLPDVICAGFPHCPRVTAPSSPGEPTFTEEKDTLHIRIISLRRRSSLLIFPNP